MFVIFAVTLMSLAAGAGLLAQLGLAIWWAMVGALAIYAGLLSLHLVARRQFAAIDTAASERLQAEIDALMPAGSEPSHPNLDDAFTTTDRTALRGDEVPSPWNIGPPETRSERGITLPEPRDTDPSDFWARQGPSLKLPDPGPSSEQAASSRTERSIAAAEQEVNVEYIQELIKKLADELNGPVQAPLPDRDAAKANAAADPDGMIGRSVEALETTARGMRTLPASDTAKPAVPVSSWWPTVPAEALDDASAGMTRAEGGKPPMLNPQLARIAEAVAAERIEVLLEPIQALAEGRTRHFEVSVRLLTADGAALEQSEFARAAQGSGLMPRIDAERMIRAARVARRLGERGRQGSVLSAIAGKSLADAEFLGTASANTGDGRMNLVLSFAQSEVRNFTAGHAEALGQLANGRLPLRARGGHRPRHGLRRPAVDGLRLRQARRAGVPRGAGGSGRRARAGLRHLPPPVRLRPDADRRPHRGRLAAGPHPGLRRAVRQRHAVRRPEAGQARGVRGGRGGLTVSVGPALQIDNKAGFPLRPRRCGLQ